VDVNSNEFNLPFSKCNRCEFNANANCNNPGIVSCMVPQSDVRIFYYFRNLCLVEFQLSNEFISFCPPERQKF